MKEIIHIGINRGFGIARGLYEKKLNNKDFEFNYSFSKAARISKNAPPSSPERIICEKLVEAHEMGAICLLEESLGNLKIKNKDKLIENLKSLKIMYDKNKFYFRNYLEIEKSISYKIKSFLLLKPSTTINPVFPKSPKLSELQEKAITKSLNSVFSIITGGPGTGKTTIIKVILNNLIKNSYDPSRIQIITPTGKAAKRVQESAQELFEENFPKPKTIHKLISFNPGTGKARFDNENPLDLDVLILDEASMADIFILNLLLEAFPSGEFKKIIFVGDPDQLLPVNSGAIFTDLVLFRKNVSELNISFRQDKDSGIINEIAKEINSGKLSGLLKYESFNIQKFDKGLQFILTEKTEEIIDIMNKWYEIYPKGTSQILTPFNKGKLGIDGINSYFTDKLDEKEYPAILIKNLSEFLLYNGETGYLI
ncbi:MAG: AAA family ATPase, partial [Leptospiraceae bacterium]|nr:AAA family ATPase [Leptospiraceae bacterium]